MNQHVKDLLFKLCLVSFILFALSVVMSKISCINRMDYWNDNGLFIDSYAWQFNFNPYHCKYPPITEGAK